MLAAVRTLLAVSALSLALFVPSSAVAETETEAPSEDVASETPPAPAKVNGTLGAYGLIGGFVGPVVLAVGYALFASWVKGSEGEALQA